MILAINIVFTFEQPSNDYFFNFRHRKKGDFTEQEHSVRARNSYDKEHFSDAAAMFENPAYEDSGKTYRF